MRTFLLSIFALSMLATTPASALDLSCDGMWAESEWVTCPAEVLVTRPDRGGDGGSRSNNGGGGSNGGGGGGGSGGGGGEENGRHDHGKGDHSAGKGKGHDKGGHK